MPRPKALERVDEDLARGDLGAARRRLASLLVSNGYDPDIVARMGRLCLQMGDRAEAGRYLLLSAEAGEEVEEAISAFVNAHRRDPHQILGQVPRYARRSFDRFPERAQQRLHALGVVEAARAETEHAVATQRSGRMALLGCLAVGIMIAGFIVIGIVTATSWLLR